MDTADKDKIRLSDRIMSALELAVAQEDLKIADILTSAMEQSMTRNTGGGEFVERRDYPPEMEELMDKLYELRSKAKSA